MKTGKMEKERPNKIKDRKKVREYAKKERQTEGQRDGQRGWDGK